MYVVVRDATIKDPLWLFHNFWLNHNLGNPILSLKFEKNYRKNLKKLPKNALTKKHLENGILSPKRQLMSYKRQLSSQNGNFYRKTEIFAPTMNNLRKLPLRKYRL